MNGKFCRKFHYQTNFDFPIGTLPTSPQYWPKEWSEIYHKEYPRMTRIKLSNKILDLGNFRNALVSRQATREYNLEKSLTFEELSTLLSYSAGVKSLNNNSAETRRFYPSGGARYPLEIYLLIQRVDTLSPGIYHYNVKENSLEILTVDKDDIDYFNEGLYYPWSRDAALTYVITSVWERNFMKYKQRGYRIILLEAGHLAHNVSLICAALGIGCCNSVGFHNTRMNDVLDIKHEDEDSLYMATIGK